MFQNLALSAYFLRSSENILDEKLDEKIYFLRNVGQKNNRFYGTKNC